MRPIFGCSKSGNPLCSALLLLLFSAFSAHAADAVRFGTNWVAEAEHGGFYQAVADGTYAKYGLDVKILPGGPQANNRLQLVKVGVTDGGEIVLSCQVLSAGFDFEMLARILGIIGYYADEVTPEIYGRLAAYCPEVAPALLC